MSNFRPINRDMEFLMPPSVDEWLPQRHLARFVVEVIEGLDLRTMTGSYRGSGEASYHPRLLLGLIIYGYATGVFSSRKLERATYDSVAFRFIAANEHPDHDTIATVQRQMWAAEQTCITASPRSAEPRRCYYRFWLPAMRRRHFRAASWSARPMIRWRSASSLRTSIPTTTRSRRFSGRCGRPSRPASPHRRARPSLGAVITASGFPLCDGGTFEPQAGARDL